MGNITKTGKNNTSITNDMKIYYASAIHPLKLVINHSANKKIISITPISDANYIEWPSNEYKHKGIKITYDTDETIDLSCDSIETGVIMWYYEIPNKKFTSYIDDNFQKYIKKNTQN